MLGLYFTVHQKFLCRAASQSDWPMRFTLEGSNENSPGIHSSIVQWFYSCTCLKNFDLDFRQDNRVHGIVKSGHSCTGHPVDRPYFFFISQNARILECGGTTPLCLKSERVEIEMASSTNRGRVAGERTKETKAAARRFALEASRTVARHAQQRLLRHILGLLGAAQHAIGKPVEVLVMLLDRLLEIYAASRPFEGHCRIPSSTTFPSPITTPNGNESSLRIEEFPLGVGDERSRRPIRSCGKDALLVPAYLCALCLVNSVRKRKKRLQNWEIEHKDQRHAQEPCLGGAGLCDRGPKEKGGMGK